MTRTPTLVILRRDTAPPDPRALTGTPVRASFLLPSGAGSPAPPFAPDPCSEPRSESAASDWYRRQGDTQCTESVATGARPVRDERSARTRASRELKRANDQLVSVRRSHAGQEPAWKSLRRSKPSHFGRSRRTLFEPKRRTCSSLRQPSKSRCSPDPTASETRPRYARASSAK